MAQGKSASHNRHSRTTSTKGFGVSGRSTSHQAPAAKLTRTTGIVGANNTKPAGVAKAMHSGTKARGSAC